MNVNFRTNDLVSLHVVLRCNDFLYVRLSKVNHREKNLFYSQLLVVLLANSSGLVENLWFIHET